MSFNGSHGSPTFYNGSRDGSHGSPTVHSIIAAHVTGQMSSVAAFSEPCVENQFICELFPILEAAGCLSRASRTVCLWSFPIPGDVCPNNPD